MYVRDGLYHGPHQSAPTNPSKASTLQVSRARPEHNLFKLAQNTIFEPNKIKSFIYLFYDSINEGGKT